MTHVITSTGFEADINEEALNDMEFVDALVDLENNKLSGFNAVAVKMLGTDGKARLYEHIRVDGRVPIQEFSNELTELIQGLQKQKK